MQHIPKDKKILMHIIQSAFDYQLKLRETLEKTESVYRKRVLVEDIKDNAEYLRRLDAKLTEGISHGRVFCRPCNLNTSVFTELVS